MLVKGDFSEANHRVEDSCIDFRLIVNMLFFIPPEFKGNRAGIPVIRFQKQNLRGAGNTMLLSSNCTIKNGREKNEVDGLPTDNTG